MPGCRSCDSKCQDVDHVILNTSIYRSCNSKFQDIDHVIFNVRILIMRFKIPGFRPCHSNSWQLFRRMKWKL